jgi:adenylosuccinate lyase
MRRLGLEVADISWQPARDRLVEYVGVLGLIGGGLAKIANEIYNLSHSEIGELEEPFSAGKVGSSTMPHKRNPSVSENVVTVGRALRYNVALMHESLVQEHERDGAGWKIEWKALPESCLMASAILAQMKYVLSGLNVHVERMRRNLDITGGLIMSERVMFMIAGSVGKQTAHEIVYKASMESVDRGITFKEALLNSEELAGVLTGENIETLLDPLTYVGLATSMVEQELAQTRAAGWLELERADEGNG